MKASFRRFRLLKSLAQNALKALMMSALIIGHAVL
jgi:hypothetical protein